MPDDSSLLFQINDKTLTNIDSQKLIKKKLTETLQKVKSSQNTIEKKSNHVGKLLLEDKTSNMMEDEEEQEYMKNGKNNLRLRKIIKSQIGNRINQANEIKKQNAKLIELFEKRELQFMEEYVTNSNNAINNFDYLATSSFRFLGGHKGHNNHHLDGFNHIG